MHSTDPLKMHAFLPKCMHFVFENACLLAPICKMHVSILKMHVFCRSPKEQNACIFQGFQKNARLLRVAFSGEREIHVFSHKAYFWRYQQSMYLGFLVEICLKT